MSDWNQLRHAYGAAGNTSALVEQLAPNLAAAVWSELRTTLRHPGTISSANCAGAGVDPATVVADGGGDELQSLALFSQASPLPRIASRLPKNCRRISLPSSL